MLVVFESINTCGWGGNETSDAFKKLHDQTFLLFFCYLSKIYSVSGAIFFRSALKIIAFKKKKTLSAHQYLTSQIQFKDTVKNLTFSTMTIPLTQIQALRQSSFIYKPCDINLVTTYGQH